MKRAATVLVTSLLLFGCGHYRHTMIIDSQGPANIRPTRKYRIAAVRELYKGEDLLAKWSGTDEATMNIRAYYQQREKDFIDTIYRAYPDVFADEGAPITVVRNMDAQNMTLGFVGVLNILVSIPTLLTIPLFSEWEWRSFISVQTQYGKSSQNKVTEHRENRASGPIPIAFCFPYSNTSDAFCVTGVMVCNNGQEDTDAIRLNKGRAIGSVIIKQLVELEHNSEKVRPTIMNQDEVGRQTSPNDGEIRQDTKPSASVVELEQIPL